MEEEEGKFVEVCCAASLFGYEGRCAAPSNFDADYCYSFRLCCFCTGLLTARPVICHPYATLLLPAEEWIAGGVPITMMMNMERRHGEMKPVIQKVLVKPGWCSFQVIRRSARPLGYRNRLRLSGSYPVLRSYGSL